jgi:uncharacterized coiled-coil protein SlyX
MRRWLVTPLVGICFLSSSGFLDRLEATTRTTVALARASEEAPTTTGQAEEELAPLPAIAGLTTQQAEAFEVLADALESSARRVEDINERVGLQTDALAVLAHDISTLDGSITCLKARLRSLLRAADDSPRALRTISEILDGLIKTQEKSIRHLKSINRKLTALGVAATAQGVEPPPRPPDAPPPSTDAAPSPIDC